MNPPPSRIGVQRAACTASAMKVITAEEVHSALSYPALVDALQGAYGGTYTDPPRQVFLLDENSGKNDAFAVLPSWSEEFIGVKV